MPTWIIVSQADAIANLEESCGWAADVRETIFEPIVGRLKATLVVEFGWLFKQKFPLTLLSQLESSGWQFFDLNSEWLEIIDDSETCNFAFFSSMNSRSERNDISKPNHRSSNIVFIQSVAFLAGIVFPVFIFSIHILQFITKKLFIQEVFSFLLCWFK